jgi:large subunit ribosomal protein L22
MEAVAKLNNCPTSPRKMRLLADLIRGKRVEDAFNILVFNAKKENSLRLEKLLRSAIANWEQKNEGADISQEVLVVKV